MRILSLRCLRWIVCSSLLVGAATCVSAQTFQNPPLIPTTTDVTSVVTADVNQDGKSDLIYVDGLLFGQRAVHILLGNGDGTFTHGQDTDLPGNICCGLTVADVTHDGKPDLILGSSNSTATIGEIAVFAGNGDGTFQAPVVSMIPQGNTGGSANFTGTFAVGDVNGDGNADLAILSSASVFVLLGDGTGHFALGSSLTIYIYALGRVYLADLNGDHKLDMVVTDPFGSGFNVALGNGDGTFSPLTRYYLMTPGGPFLLTDLDGDGHLDVVTTYYQGQIGYFKGKPDGTFSALIPLGASPSAGQLVAATDLNSDGIPDMIFITNSGIVVSLGQTGPAFGPPLTTISGGSTNTYTNLPITPVAGDFNGDGHPDLAAAVEGGIALLIGKGNGTFVSVSSYDMGQTVGAVAVADFNGDKVPDIAVTLPAPLPRLLFGNGQGAFTLGPDPNASYGAQTADTNIETADFKGDGKEDVDMGTQDPYAPSIGTQTIAFGNGDGSFKTPIIVSNPSPSVGDFNNDGRSDMISINGDIVSVLLGQTDGTFKVATTTLQNASSTIGFGDVNKDGKLDLIINYSDHLEIWLGKGDGTFTYFTSVASEGLAYSPIDAVADIDGDGNSDILFVVDSSVLPGYGYLTIFYGNGDGTFQAPVTIPTSHQYTQAIVADLNRDNLPDLVLSDGAGIATMMNLGGRKFDSERFYIAGRSLSWLSVADVNQDGYPDIVVGNPGASTVAVLLNQPNGASPEGAATSGTLVLSPEPSISGSPLTISLAMAGTSPGNPIPTGSVEFDIDGGILGTAPLVNGSASYVVASTLIPIKHTVVATYYGDATYATKSFAALHNALPPTYTTQTTLSATPAVLLTSQTVRLVATVACTPPVPAGIVTFFDGTNTLGAAQVNASGTAYLDTALLAAGTHSLTSTYQGFWQPGFTGTNTGYTAAIFAASTSTPVTVNVTSNATITTVSFSTASPTAGTVVSFTANVSSTAGVPFGDATFYDGISALGTLGLNADGSAAFSTASLTAGTHTITAAFNANGPFGESTSSPVTISVVAAPPTASRTVVSLAPEISSAAGSTILTAKVSDLKSTPAGIVTFLDSGVILGVAETDPSGTATLNLGALGSGAHRLSASFTGSSDFAPSASREFQDMWPVAGPGFSLDLSKSSLQVSTEGSESFGIDIVPIAGFGQQVQLSCAAGLPEGYTCNFSPSTLEGGGGSTLILQPPLKKASSLSATLFSYGITVGLLAVLFLGGGRNERLCGAVLLFLCCTIIAMNGCATAPSSRAQSQMAVLTIRAASGSGSTAIVHYTQVSLKMNNLN